MNILELAYLLWRRKLFVAICVTISVISGVVFALSEDEVYEAKVTVLPGDPPDAMAGLGQLANLGGIAGLGLGLDGHAAAAMTFLKSDALARTFIAENDLMPAFFPNKWDMATGRWRVAADRSPQMWDAVDYFRRKVVRVEEVKKTGSVNVYFRSGRAESAALLANKYIELVNREMRKSDSLRKTKNIEYLRNQLAVESNVEVQKAIANIIESEIKGLMLAHGNVEYAYRVVDPAYPPTKRVYPFRSLIVVGFAFFGLVVAVLLLAAVPPLVSSYRRVSSLDQRG